MALPSREVPYIVPPRFATIKAVGGGRPKTPNSERVRLWQDSVRPGTLAEKPLPMEEPPALSPMPEKKKRWRRLAETLHPRKRDRRNEALAVELRSETDRLDAGSDAVSLTFQTARSDITEQEEDVYIYTTPVDSLLHSGWEENSKRSRVRESNGTIQALPPIPSWMLRKERIVQQADSAMDPAGLVLYEFLGFGGK